MWNYAELSKEAKEAGSPEKLMATTKNAARAEGRISMIPLVFLASIPSICSLIDHFKKKRKNQKETLELAEQKLIDGIKEYDREHPEDVGKEP